MVKLTATLAATPLASLVWLEPRLNTGGRLGRVTGAAADPLPQAGQFGGQGGELGTQLLERLLLGQDQRTNSDWCRQPIRC
jgi:hypothetical protein